MDLLVTCIQIKGWEINSTKVQGHSTSVKFLEIQWCGAFRGIPSKVKDKLLCLALLTTKKEAQHPVYCFNSEYNNSSLVCVSQAYPYIKMLSHLLDLIGVWSRHLFWSWICHSLHVLLPQKLPYMKLQYLNHCHGIPQNIALEQETHVKAREMQHSNGH